MNSKYCAFLILISAFSLTAYANEALLRESSGSFSLVENDTTQIRMVSERVVIELGDSSYTVDAKFEFMNEGDTITVLVGFPNHGYGFAPRFTGVSLEKTFETWVNGEKVAFKDIPGYMKTGLGETGTVITDSDSLNAAHSILQEGLLPFDSEGPSQWIEEMRWLVKEVTFPEGKTTTTQVRYTVDYGASSHQEYIYGTGRTWKGTIDQTVFVLKLSTEGWLGMLPEFGRGLRFTSRQDFEKRRIGEFELEYILTDFEPHENDVFRFYPKPGAFLSPWEAEGSFRFDDSIVADDFLDILSLTQLRLLRNAFFYHHGKEFTQPDLIKYFRENTWEKPHEVYKEGALTDNEMKSVRKIIPKEEWLREFISRK